jgi:uncharacterized membrane protein
VELAIICLLTLICFPVITLTEGIVRIILGVIFLLIFPGYTILTAIFPAKNKITGLERTVLTPLLSFALVSLAGLALNYTPWGITLTTVYIAMTIIIVICSAITLVRRARLPESERFSLAVRFKMPKRGNTSKLDIALYICLAVIVIGAASTLVYVVAHPKAQEPFTNFYVLGAEEMMENYPKQLSIGVPAFVTLGIDNHENKDTSYSIKVTSDGAEIQSLGPILLTSEGKWSGEAKLTPPKIGDNQKVDFTLYKGEEPAPYLTLHLWVNVKE